MFCCEAYKCFPCSAYFEHCIELPRKSIIQVSFLCVLYIIAMLLPVCHAYVFTLITDFMHLWNRMHSLPCQQWRNKTDQSINFFPEQNTKPAFGQWKIKENHTIKSKLDQKLYDENLQPVNIAKPTTSQFFIHLTSIVVAILGNSIVLQAHLYSAFRPNQWLKSWPPEKLSILLVVRINTMVI